MKSENKTSIFQENKKSYIVLLVMLGILTCCWIALAISCKAKSSHLYTYTYDKNNLQDVQDGLSLSMEISKSWEDATYHLQTPCGAQYDFAIDNNSSFSLTNFSVDVTMSQKLIFDGGWNGAFEVEDNVIHFTSEEPIHIIASGNQSTFGAIIYTEEIAELESFVIKGYWNANIKESRWYWPLLEISFLCVAFLFFRLYGISSKYTYQKKAQRDYEIIEQSMKTMTEFIDAKDAYTKDHSTRVAKYAREIGRRWGLDEESIRNLYFISLMHDCGKITIPDEILKKEGPLSPEEFEIVKTHTTKGSELLKRFNALPGIGDGAHYHHERYDGFGYPTGLEGENIPLFARIIGVADAYDAMSSNRCYRKALSKEKILSELSSNSGKQFDPKLVPIMVEMIEDGFVDKIREEYKL